MTNYRMFGWEEDERVAELEGEVKRLEGVVREQEDKLSDLVNLFDEIIDRAKEGMQRGK